jgi:caffeoyl-CoA O-methyltransferase
VPVVPEEIDAYCEAHTTAPPEYLRALAEETRASLPTPQMLTGAIEGRFLEALVFAMGARDVLELGTYSGYSALSMAAALPEGGKVVSCELEPERAEFARRHIEAAGYGDRVELRVGPALETLGQLEGPFDLIFIDADKTGYPRYYEACVPLLAERGLLVIDNTLWGGRVLEGRSDGSEATEALRALNERIVTDERVVAVMLPIRDGVTLVRQRR